MQAPNPPYFVADKFGTGPGEGSQSEGEKDNRQSTEDIAMLDSQYDMENYTGSGR